MEWIEITCDSKLPLITPFLLSDEYGVVYIGSTAFEFFDAKYWFPLPSYPMGKAVITNDAFISKILRD